MSIDQNSTEQKKVFPFILHPTKGFSRTFIYGDFNVGQYSALLIFPTNGLADDFDTLSRRIRGQVKDIKSLPSSEATNDCANDYEHKKMKAAKSWIRRLRGAKGQRFHFTSFF